MKPVIIASAKNELRRKIIRLLRLSQVGGLITARSVSDIRSIVSREKEGIVIYSPMNALPLIELDRMLPVGWDIVAILPSGMPQPFYSSSLTVLSSPVSPSGFTQTVLSLLSSSSLRKTEYPDEKRDTVEKAKGIIMKERNTDENSAHRCLQKGSMESGKPLFEVAGEIISVYSDKR